MKSLYLKTLFDNMKNKIDRNTKNIIIASVLSLFLALLSLLSHSNDYVRYMLFLIFWGLMFMLFYFTLCFAELIKGKSKRGK